jgi:hypothetical protein
VVDEALGRRRRTDALVDDRYNLENALALNECLDPIADLDLGGGFGSAAVHAHFPSAAGGRRRRPSLEEPDRPQPDVHPRRVDDDIVESERFLIRALSRVPV